MTDRNYAGLVQDLLDFSNPSYYATGTTFFEYPIAVRAADAIEELIFERDKYKSFFDRIANLPDCNTCLKKRECEFVPRAGEHTRINCAFYVPDPREVKNE